MADSLLCVGVVTGARGLKGEVRIKSFTASPEDVAAYGPVRDESGGRSFKIRVTGRAKGTVTARLQGVGDRNGAEALKGLKLYVSRDALPKAEDEEFYHADLIGLEAVFADGEVLGAVTAVHDYGGGASLEVDGGPRGPVMTPFTKACVPVVDLEKGRVVIERTPGLLETPKGEGTET